MLAGVVVLGLACSDDGDDDALTAAPAEPAETVSSGTDSAAAAPSSATATTSASEGAAPRQPGAISDEAPPDSASTDATTLAPPPATGDITETVPAEPQETLASVPLDESVDVAEVATVELVSIERVDAEARLPGEIAGPAVAIGVRITNIGTESLELGTVTVNVRDADGRPSAPLTSEPADPLEGELAPDQDADGVYLFEFGDDRAEPLTIEVSPTVEAPVAVFVGQLS